MTISIDGCGVTPDQPLPDGTRLRVGLDADPRNDVSIFVHRGRIHVVGQYGRVVAEKVAPNYVELFTLIPVIKDSQDDAA